MKAFARVVFLAGAVAIGLFLFRATPRDVTLVYAVAASGARELDVEIAKGAETVRRAEFRLDPAAAAQVSHRVRLADGEYVVHLTLSSAGDARRIDRPITVTESGTIVVPISW
ncbi:MAG TPA: hypothetical protein VF904_00410 [Anaeromyxobacteraceae bacterium]